MASSGGTTGTPISGGTPLSGTVETKQDWPIFPLDEFRRMIGYHPWHFWGLADGDDLKVDSNCNTVIPEYPWQRSQSQSRQDIRDALLNAEARLREQLVFSVGRRFVTETIKFPRPNSAGHQFNYSIDGNGRWLGLRLSEGYVRALGVETYSVVSAGVTAVASDQDGDGVNETFTVTVNTAVTDPDELGVYFTSADRLDGEGVSERYRIQPVHVKIASGVATITGRRWLLVKPKNYEAVTAGNGLNPTTDGVLATTVDVYRRYCNQAGTTEDTAQALLVWETDPYPVWAESSTLSFTDSSLDPAATAVAIARGGVRSSRLGEVYLGRANYSSDNENWVAVDWGSYRQPDRVIVRYEAGADLRGTESDSKLDRLRGVWPAIVFRLACAEMKQRPMGCDDASQNLYRWQFDRSLTGGAGGEQYRVSNRDLDCPWGTAAGALYAWHQVNNLRVTRAFSM